MKGYTSKIMQCNHSGFAMLSLSPNRSKKGTPRIKKYKSTYLAQQRANERRSRDNCFLEAVDNFMIGDWFASITFSDDTLDTERILLFKKVIRFLQRRAAKNGIPLKYMYIWGRGENKSHLHTHSFFNSAISFEDISACNKLYKDVHITVERIENNRGYNNDSDVIEYIVDYMFYPHWYSLNPQDKRALVKKHYYTSQSMSKVSIIEKNDDEVDRPIEDSPNKLMKAILRNPYNTDHIDSLVRKVLKGYRLESSTSSVKIYTDWYNHFYVKIKLIRIGSILDHDQDV